jgi:acetylornithine deacetylase/succinyl-diaminopimelate desuccinylase-like protein
MVEDDKIYGLGALDMKSGCCSSMLALRKFHKLHTAFTVMQVSLISSALVILIT